MYLNGHVHLYFDLQHDVQHELSHLNIRDMYTYFSFILITFILMLCLLCNVLSNFSKPCISISDYLNDAVKVFEDATHAFQQRLKHVDRKW